MKVDGISLKRATLNNRLLWTFSSEFKRKTNKTSMEVISPFSTTGINNTTVNKKKTPDEEEEENKEKVGRESEMEEKGGAWGGGEERESKKRGVGQREREDEGDEWTKDGGRRRPQARGWGGRGLKRGERDRERRNGRDAACTKR